MLLTSRIDALVWPSEWFMLCTIRWIQFLMEKKTLRKKSFFKNVAKGGFSNKCYKNKKIALIFENTMSIFLSCQS